MVTELFYGTNKNVDVYLLVINIGLTHIRNMRIYIVYVAF
jgi:hypothetical protein